MRILLLSDIHSNLEALNATVESAPPHDLVVNLGDVVGYGASPNEVIDVSRKLGKVFVRGNHDKAAAGLMDLTDFNPIAGMAALWTRDNLSTENLQWLRELPAGPVHLDNDPLDAQFVHGSPMDEDEYLVSLRDALEPLMAYPIALTFFGHSHIQGGFLLNAKHEDVLKPTYHANDQHEVFTVPLKKEVQYLINPGSVGQPRDGDWRASYALFDSDKYEVEFHRVPYDIRTAQDRILAANLPPRLAARLAAGR